MNAVPFPDAYPPRQSLSRSVGRLVTVEATFAEDTRKLDDGRKLHLLRTVYVFPHAEFSHIWIELPQHARRRLTPGQRFAFHAEVVRYTRSNGSVDFSLNFVEWVR